MFKPPMSGNMYGLGQKNPNSQKRKLTIKSLASVREKSLYTEENISEGERAISRKDDESRRIFLELSYSMLVATLPGKVPLLVIFSLDSFKLALLVLSCCCIFLRICSREAPLA